MILHYPKYLSFLNQNEKNFWFEFYKNLDMPLFAVWRNNPFTKYDKSNAIIAEKLLKKQWKY